ncbi:hypothetical protein MHBO_002454 [Bonamia ostreae]|uniref:Geranylgeranyl transferase type-2 subunit alpha n=1 Tax=Bonamia ostreae TaxID=126728 RepID=A0ABV2AMA9_9EUKA
MHNIRRDDYYSRSNDDVQKTVHQIEKYNKLCDIVLAMKTRKAFSEKAIFVTEKILLINPDFYNSWNFRKEITDHFLNNAQKDQKIKICLEELKLSKKALYINPKSYPSWYHRKWIFDKNILDENELSKELLLTEKLLDIDERNFHCWSHRRHIVNLAKTALKDEFDFTTRKIEDNFSNYSAWHYRAILIKQMTKKQHFSLNLKDEFDIVTSAIFTDPQDSSSWLYLFWLLKRELKIDNILSIFEKPKIESFPTFGKKSVLDENIQNLFDNLRNLEKDENDCCWLELALVILDRSFGDFGGKTDLRLEKLREIDSLRKNMYSYLKNK